MNLRIRIVISLFICAVFCGIDIHAYELMRTESGERLYWPDDKIPIKWHINEMGCPHLPFEDVRVALQASFSAWQDIDCSYVEFQYAGTLKIMKFGPDAHYNPDFKNTLSWVEDEWPDEWSEAYAVTIPAYNLSNGRIVDADMEFNAAWFTWAILSEESSANPDVQNIATHEIGHFIGLAHSEDMEATLFPYGVPGELHKRTLAEDDIFGACYLYPIKGNSGWPCKDEHECKDGRSCVINPDSSKALCSVSCHCDSDCPSSMACVDSYCLPFPHEVGRDMGDACSISRPCTASLICLENICSDYCSNSSQCPEDWDCVPISDGGRACYGQAQNGGDGDRKIEIYDFTANKTSPQIAGTKIKLSADIDDGAECRFIARNSGGNYTTIQNYSASCQTIWLPTETGSYELFIEARTTDSNACYDARKSLLFTVLSGDEKGSAPEDERSADRGEGDGGDDKGCNNTGNETSKLCICILAAVLLFRRRKLF